MAEAKIDVRQILNLVNSARVAAGWPAVTSLPGGEIGIEWSNSPLCLALDCTTDNDSAIGSSEVVKFARAWGTWSRREVDDIWRAGLPSKLASFNFRFFGGELPEFIDPHRQASMDEADRHMMGAS